MVRKIKNLKSKDAIVVIADGQDEKWYIEKVKEHYKPNVLRRISIKPDLFQRKKVSDLFDEAESKLGEGYTQVILIVDFDEIGKNRQELNKFSNYFNQYVSIKAQNTKSSRKYAWMKNMILIVNSPCIEYWYLLHYKNTTKFYSNFSDLKIDLLTINEFKCYKKNQSYYRQTPDIFSRLGGMKGLANARNNARQFRLEKCFEQGFSEMNKLFDFFDRLN